MAFYRLLAYKVYLINGLVRDACPRAARRWLDSRAHYLFRTAGIAGIAVMTYVVVGLTALNSAGLTPTWLAILFGNRLRS